MVRITPPHAPDLYESAKPMSRRAVENKLYELGNHTADIAEAFLLADEPTG